MKFGGFSFGSGKQSSQSSSLDLGLQTSFSDSLSEAFSRSQTGGQSTSSQSVWNAGVLEKLYGDAVGAVERTNPALFTGQLGELFEGGADILDRLGVGAGEDYLSSRLTDTSARDAQLDVLQQRMGSLWSDEINPAITSRHVAGGTLGGSRQGVAQAQGAGRVAREFASGATEILSRDQASKDAAAAQLMSGRTQAAQVGLNALPGLAGIAEMGFGAELSPHAMLASIVGGPAVLSESQSSQFGESSSESVARAISEALGFNYGTSQSSSKGKSFNFGLG